MSDPFRDALGALDDYDPDRAREIAERLEAAGDGRVLELRARILVAEFDPDGAIALLRAGLETSPGSARLWELLGRIHADRREVAEASAAWERAEACDDAWLGSIRYNRAVLALNTGRPEEAIAGLQGVEDFGDAELAQHATDALLRAFREVRDVTLRPAPVFEVTVVIDLEDGTCARQTLTGWAPSEDALVAFASADLDPRYGAARREASRTVRVDPAALAGLSAVGLPTVLSSPGS